VAEWSHLYPAWDVPTAEREFAAMTQPGAVPTTFVAFAGPGRTADDVLGSISIIGDDELAGFEHLTPWLASLYVVPSARSAGIGSVLVDHA
jgi:GNAT superfamily N-acetyltransferase